MGLSDSCFEFLEAIEANPGTFDVQLNKLEEELGFWSDSPIYPQGMLDATYGVICAARAGVVDATTIREPLRRAGWAPDRPTLAEERTNAASEGWVFVEPVKYTPRPRTLDELAFEIVGFARPLGGDKESSTRLLTDLLPKLEAATTPDEDLKVGLISLVSQTLEGTLAPEFLVQRAMAIHELLEAYEELAKKKAALLAGTSAA